MQDRRFKQRHCPACGNESADVLLEVTAAQVVGSNWSYRSDALAMLDLHGEATFPIVRCTRCGFGYARWQPDDDFLSMLYDQVIDADAARTHSFTRGSMVARMNYLAILLALVRDEGRVGVLDYGCGFGPTLALLTAARTVDACGFDASLLRSTELRACGQAVCADLHDVARRAPFHAVILDNVLEHLVDPRATLRQITTWCTPGAVLAVGVPECDPAALRRLQKSAPHGRALPMDINPWEHLNYFTAKTLDVTMKDAGFQAIAQSRLPCAVDIGLRPEPRRWARLRNAAASGLRLAGYALYGDTGGYRSMRFYRVGTPR